jgi:hypothetical protein
MKQKNFADVLYEKIEAKILAEIGLEARSQTQQTQQSAKFHEDLNPTCLSHLIGKIARPQAKSSHKSGGMRRPQTYIKSQNSSQSSSQTDSARQSTKSPPLASHQDQSISEALWLFRTYGEDIPLQFSISDIKAAFRSLAMRLHPDRGGNSREFMNIRKAFAVLTKASS